MLPRVSDGLRAVERWAAPPGTPSDDRRKRTYVCLSLTLLTPAVAIFGIFDLLQGNVVEGCAVITLAAFMAALSFILSVVRDARPVFRLGAALILLLQGYELSIGGGGGYALLWFYCFPILALALFGTREGIAWVAAALASAAFVLFSLLSSGPMPASTGRFLVSYTLVAFFSYGLESSRERLDSQLSAEKHALQDVLAQVKTLRGLLPMCTGCKKIRDDRGYWQQIEAFIANHSRAELTHGICPDCATKYLSRPGHRG